MRAARAMGVDPIPEFGGAENGLGSGFCAAVGAGLIQTVTGFGAAVMMMLVLPSFFGLVQAPALASVIALGLSAGLFWKLRRQVDYKLVLIQAAIYVSVSTVTISQSGGFDIDLLALVFGLFLICLSLYYLFLSKAVAVRPGPVTALVCGVGAGFFGGLFGVGDPLSAVYFLAASKSKESYVANLQMLFVISNTVNTIVRVRYGVYTLALVPLSLVGIVGINLGKLAGLRILDRIDIEGMKRIVYIFIGVSGVLTLAGHL